MKSYTIDIKGSTFSYQLPKIYLHFNNNNNNNKRSLMKLEKFDFKPSLLPVTPTPITSSYQSPHSLLNRRTQKTVSVRKSSIE